jgi:hypothetical protein
MTKLKRSYCGVEPGWSSRCTDAFEVGECCSIAALPRHPTQPKMAEILQYETIEQVPLQEVGKQQQQP